MNTWSFCHGIVDIDGSDGIGICEINCFQSKTQKQQNTKRISQNIPQLDQSCEDTPCNFWPKMLGHLNVDDFVVGNQNIDRISLSNLYDPVALNLMLLLFLAPSWADPS